MSKRLIISWQEGTLCGHSSCVRPLCRAFCRPLADASPYYCKRSASAGCLRSLSSFVSPPLLRSSHSRPSNPGPRPGAKRTVGHRLTINHCLCWQRRFQRGRFRFMDAVCSAYSISAAVLGSFSSIIRRRELHPLKSSSFSRRTVTPTTGSFCPRCRPTNPPGWVIASTASSISLRLELFFRCSALSNGSIINGFDCGRKSCSSSASLLGKH
jgi:hypothetical protein